MAFRRGFSDKEGVLYLTHFWQIGFGITFLLWKAASFGEEGNAVLFKVSMMSKYFPNASQNFVTFQVLELKTIVSPQDPKLTRGIGNVLRKNSFFRFDTAFGFTSNLLYLGLNKAKGINIFNANF